MNIGIVVDNDLNNDKRVLREAEILISEDHKVYALCFGFDKKTYSPIEGLVINRIKISRRIKNILFFLMNIFPAYEWLWASRIKDFISLNSIEIIHAHDLYMAKSAYRGIRNSGKDVKLVLDLHENFAYQVTTYNWTRGFLRNLLSRPDLWGKKEKEYLEYAHRIVVLSDEFRDLLVSKYPLLNKENFCTLPNLPDVEQMNSFISDLSAIPFEKKCPIMFYFGIVAERRGIFTALSAFSDIVKDGADMDFMIIGPVDKKDQPQFNKIIGSDVLRSRIKYVPWIDLSDLPAYLEISDICIAPFLKNPQHDSGVANKIFDYMLGGKPIIASDCGPQKKIIEMYNCGLVYSTYSELKASIIRLLNDRDLRNIMGKNGYDAVIGLSRLANTRNNLINLYNSFR